MPNNHVSTQKGICASPRRVGRKLRYPEKREIAFPEGTLARLQDVLNADENQANLMREAVLAEIERREAKEKG